MKKTLTSALAAIVVVALSAAPLASASTLKSQPKAPVQTLQEGGPCAGC